MIVALAPLIAESVWTVAGSRGEVKSADCAGWARVRDGSIAPVEGWGGRCNA
ncbi:hypothetical protein DB30_04775 [Enhygromyxa salina]|uniref:Uncharacterized protein n=1 Tax=Enhygromyxa salina TaxID=215803 RepID=A0A0C2D3K7_9BACT|nr:hypothetical protein DB30_04775 [Enhygromyxa salina]